MPRQCFNRFVILRHSFDPPDNARLARLCGSLDEHLRSIELALGVNISRRNEFFRVEGAKDNAGVAMHLLQTLHERAEMAFSAEQVQFALEADSGQRSLAVFFGLVSLEIDQIFLTCLVLNSR